MIVDSQGYLGTYSKSPFNFARTWTVKARAIESARSALHVENAYLKSSIEDIKSQMSVLVDYIQKQKNETNEDALEVTTSDSDEESLKSKKARKNKKNVQLSASATKQVTTRARTNNMTQEKSTTSQPSGFLDRIFGATKSNSNYGSEASVEDLNDVLSQKSLPQSCNDFSVEQKYWITKIELELMSSPLDQECL